MGLKILVIHGPNLNLLGDREESIYGKTRLEDINRELKKRAKEKGYSLEVFQSNHEGEIVDRIGKARGKVDLLILNPAAYTHTSVAIRDALLAVELPTIEVHLSHIYRREEFRQKSLVAPACVGQICGFGPQSYYLALEAAESAAAKKETN